MNNRDKTHCKSGHPFDKANTIWRVRKSGAQRRHCRECDRLACKTYYNFKVKPRRAAERNASP